MAKQPTVHIRRPVPVRVASSIGLITLALMAVVVALPEARDGSRFGDAALVIAFALLLIAARVHRVSAVATPTELRVRNGFFFSTKKRWDEIEEFDVSVPPGAPNALVVRAVLNDRRQPLYLNASLRDASGKRGPMKIFTMMETLSNFHTRASTPRRQAAPVPNRTPSDGDELG